MQPTPTQLDILRATAAFATVARYQGTMPKRQALLYATADLTALENAGLLERIKLSYPCGKALTGWRLTAAGHLALQYQEILINGEIESEHLRILSDVYHFSRISRYRGMMPKELAKEYDDDDLRDLFMHGYLLRIRLKGDGKVKGWLVSNKGLAALRQAEEARVTPPAAGGDHPPRTP
ncbi:MAG: hypothetical protein AB9872_09930 [Solidesulfovibrio sp.]